MEKRNSEFSPQRKIRDILFLTFAIFCFILYLPNIIIYLTGKYILHKESFSDLDKDIEANVRLLNIRLNYLFGLLFLLHNNSYFRSLFYFRIGYIRSLLVGWYRPGNKYFILSKTLKMRGGCCWCILFPLLSMRIV